MAKKAGLWAMPRTGHRPTCINHGCNDLVVWMGTRWRPVCSACHKASYGAVPFREGITPFRTGKCSNQSGHLGFICPIDYDKAPWAIGHTSCDHIDGNHLNNVPENCQELCDICHREKGKIEGDYKQRRYKY